MTYDLVLSCLVLSLLTVNYKVIYEIKTKGVVVNTHFCGKLF